MRHRRGVTGDPAPSTARSHKIRCAHCGAKNDPIEMCRLCGLSLPGAEEIRRNGPLEAGPSFEETVESQLAEWRHHVEPRIGPRSPGAA